MNQIQPNKGSIPPHVEKNFRSRPPRTKEALDAYIRYFYDVFLASVAIEEGNSCPLDFAWDIYSSAMDLKEYVGLDDFNFLGMACRSGQKSLTCATIESLMMTFDEDRDYFHMASILDQSKITYGYVQTIFNKDLLRDLVKSTTMKETVAHTDRILKIGTGTIKSVNSYHGSVIQDEVDLTDHRVFIESKGMLSPGKNNKSPLDIKISSRKFGFGNIQSLLDKKEKDPDYPLRIHRWGILEMMQHCPTERSITESKSVIVYVDEENLHAISDVEHSTISDSKVRDQYQAMSAYPGCLKCGIFSFCKGQAKKQTRDNPYLIAIDDVKRLYLTDDTEFFKSQRLNRKPSSLGRIYNTWSPAKHIKNYESMFEIVFGREWGSAAEEEDELTLKLFVQILCGNGCKLYIGDDFGFNVAVALLGVKDGSGRILVLDEIVVETASDADFALSQWEQWKDIADAVVRGFGDVAAPGAIKECSQYFPMLQSIVAGHKDLTYQEYAKLSKDYKFRFGLIRKLLAAPGTKEAKIFVAPHCVELITNIGIYRCMVQGGNVIHDVPANNQRDHACDALAHLVVGIEVAGAGHVNAVLVDTPTSNGVDEANADSEYAEYATRLRSLDTGIKMPVRSVAIDPETGLKLAPVKVETPPEPRGNKKFRCTVVE